LKIPTDLSFVVPQEKLILYWIFKYIYNKERDDLKSQYLTFSINLSSLTPFFTHKLPPFPYLHPQTHPFFHSIQQNFPLERNISVFFMISLPVQRFFKIKKHQIV
jgi:hypothetical protein